MKLLRLVLGFLAGLALVRWFLDLGKGHALPPTIPIAVTDPDAGAGGDGPDRSDWPAFDPPRYSDPGILPAVPECDTVYMLVYVDAFEWGGATQRTAIRKARQRGPDLLKWARDQANRYCARNPLCQGVMEIDHQIQWAVYPMAGEDIIELTITYFFKCEGVRPGYTRPPRDQTGHAPYYWVSPTPYCNGEFTFVAHARTPVAFGCQGADARAAEAAHERSLLADAQFHARNFCAGVPEPICRDVLERGRHFTHRCALSRTTGESWVLSTLVYRFDCAALV